MGMNPNEYHMFRKSQPFGYYPPDVESKIHEYEVALKEINDKYVQEVQNNNILKDKISRLQDELREMHIQMSSLELPDTDEITQGYVLNTFKQYNEVPQQPSRKINLHSKNEEKVEEKEDQNDDDDGDDDLPFLIIE